MEKQYIISIDIGTSSCKTALFDNQGNILSIAAQEHKTSFGSNKSVDQNPADWWQGSIRTVRAAMDQAGVSASQIAVIGIDSQSSSMIPMSRNGKVLHPAMIWTDRRAAAEKAWIDREIGQDILTEISGNRNDESNLAPKLLWFKNNYPSLYQDTYKILNAAGYLVYQLTGIFSTNISEGGLTQLFDVQEGIWSKELIKACKLDIDKLPSIYPCYEVVGGLTKQAAQQIGLIEGIPVVAGSMDAVACGLGCGIIHKGDAFITGGTVTAMGVCTDKPVKTSSLHVYHHIVPNSWCNLAGVDYGGGNYRWFRDRFMEGYDNETVYDEMNRMAQSVPLGADKLLFLPTCVGQRCPQWDGDMRGVFFGVTPTHTKKHFIRAIMEGNAFAMREIMELLEQSGAQVDNLMIAGGIARSEIWMKIFEDVLGRLLYLATFEETTAVGNMLTAAYGVGIIDDFAVAKEYGKFNRVPFQEENHEKYKQLYKIYQNLYPALKESFGELSQLEF